MDMNFYEILHIAENAPDEIIKLAYKGLAQKYHPDRYKGTDANQKMVQIREAYEILSNPIKRTEYYNYLKNLRFTQKAKENETKQNYQKPAQNDCKQAKKLFIKKQKTKKYIGFFILAIFIILMILGFLIKPKEAESRHSYDEDIVSEPSQTSDNSLDSELINSESTEEFNIQLANSTPVIETNLTTASQKELITYDERLLKMAIQQLFSTYEENGMIGLVSDIQECYEQNENIKYCFYLDYSTRIFEFHMSESMNTSPYEFFNDETFHSRIFTNYYSKIQVDDVDLVNQQLLFDAEKINELLPEAANKRFTQ